MKMILALVPAKLRKTVEKYDLARGGTELQNEQRFSPTIVRIKRQHAMEPSKIEVPTKLSASACDMLKNDKF